jgi:hypothetical protein
MTVKNIVFCARGGATAILATTMLLTRLLIATIKTEIRTLKGRIIEHHLKEPPFGNSQNCRIRYALHR